MMLSNKTFLTLKRVLFFWIFSFLIAAVCYYILLFLLPGNQVFGSWYRMLGYHKANPLQYIAIPCFFYGIVATLCRRKFKKGTTNGRLIWTAVIVVITLLVSSPFGGMLWYFHDMQAGFFPDNWIYIIISEGIVDGLTIGWLIVLLSFPYNILGTVVCFYLTRKGLENFT